MRPAGVWIRELLSMAREEFIKSCKLVDQIIATVTAIIFDMIKKKDIYVSEKKNRATLTACLWIISRSTNKITWHVQNFLATLEKFGRTS